MFGMSQGVDQLATSVERTEERSEEETGSSGEGKRIIMIIVGAENMTREDIIVSLYYIQLSFIHRLPRFLFM